MACRMELAGKQDGYARPFGPHEELSQEQQEPTKWLVVKLIIKSNQDIHQKLIEDMVNHIYIKKREMPWKDQDSRRMEKVVEVDKNRYEGTNSATTTSVQASAGGNLDQHSSRGHGGRWQDSSEALERRLFRTWRWI